MECAVYDTYIRKKDGKIMHFDVVVEASTPHERAVEYGRQYLSIAGLLSRTATGYKRWKAALHSLLFIIIIISCIMAVCFRQVIVVVVVLR
jgi:hypothetical protein